MKTSDKLATLKLIFGLIEATNDINTYKAHMNYLRGMLGAWTMDCTVGYEVVDEYYLKLEVERERIEKGG